jgi:hypothetical protein
MEYRNLNKRSGNAAVALEIPPGPYVRVQQGLEKNFEQNYMHITHMDRVDNPEADLRLGTLIYAVGTNFEPVLVSFWMDTSD